MEFLKKYDLSVPQLLKVLALAVAALIVVAFISSVFKGSPLGQGISDGSITSLPSIGVPQYYGESDVAYDEKLSTRNVAGSMPIVPEGDNYISGASAEEYEVKDYRATIETRDMERDCGIIRDLKSREDVIFENTSEYDRGCSYTFKVKKDSVSGVLLTIEELEPKELIENAYTIKEQVDDFTSEIEILEKKLVTIDATLESATAQYDSITSLATRVEDVESLAKIINSKLTIIERLTEERLRTSSELERILRAKAEQLDRLEYTYFYVNIYEEKYLDGKALRDSWQRALKQFVYDINTIAQDLSIGLVALIFFVLQYAIYFFILLFVVRTGWGLTKRIWNGKNTNTVPRP